MKENEIILKYYNELCGSEMHFFPLKGKVNVSNNHGVYVIYSELDEVMHAGMTPYGKEGLNQRLYNHISKTGVFYRNYLKTKNLSLRGICKFRYIEIPDPRQRALVEALTAGMLCPSHFGTGVKIAVLENN